MDWTLFHMPYGFDSPHGTLTFKNRRMTVNMKQCGFYDGDLNGVIDLDLRSNPADYMLDLNLVKVELQEIHDAHLQLRQVDRRAERARRISPASIGVMETMNGKGEVKIDDGDITPIPLLGSLTPLIPGFSAADAAHGHFTVGEGRHPHRRHEDQQRDSSRSSATAATTSSPTSSTSTCA